MSYILCISETRLKLSKASLISIFLASYNIEDTKTELSNGISLIYIKMDIKYKLRKDLQIYKGKELESTFIEFIQQGENKNIITGCIYCHTVI